MLNAYDGILAIPIQYLAILRLSLHWKERKKVPQALEVKGPETQNSSDPRRERSETAARAKRGRENFGG